MSNDHGSPGELHHAESYDLTRVPTEDSFPEPTRASTDKSPPTQWKPSSRTVDETLAEGLSNEDLWVLIRRFNKVRRDSRSGIWCLSVLGAGCAD